VPIGSPIPHTRLPGALRRSTNWRQAGMMRAGFEPISRMSANCTSSASPASSALRRAILDESTATSTASSTASAAWMNGRAPARNCSSPAYRNASWRNAGSDPCTAALALMLAPALPLLAPDPPSKDAPAARETQVPNAVSCLRLPLRGTFLLRP
jgi:hypothetical protein